MLLIGLTGGIASGKTLVSDAFSALGVSVVDADIIAREVVMPGSEGLAKLVNHFSTAILTEYGELDRNALRKIIFENPSARKTVDKILHPLIREQSDNEIAHIRDTGESYAIYAVPLLVETKQAARFDRILLVDVPVEVQLERIVRRDNTTKEHALAIIDSQASRAERQAVATDTILNVGSVDDVVKQVEKLHAVYTNLAKV